MTLTLIGVKGFHNGCCSQGTDIFISTGSAKTNNTDIKWTTELFSVTQYKINLITEKYYKIQMYRHELFIGQRDRRYAVICRSVVIFVSQDWQVRRFSRTLRKCLTWHILHNKPIFLLSVPVDLYCNYTVSTDQRESWELLHITNNYRYILPETYKTIVLYISVLTC